MRQIGSVPDEAAARKLADYLLTQGITTRLDPAADGRCAVWVHREDQVEAARRELAAFVASPDDARYQGAAGAARALRKEAERVRREHVKNTHDVRSYWAARDLRHCPLTFALIGASVAVSLLSGWGSDPGVVFSLQVASYRLVSPEEIRDDRPDDARLVGGHWVRSDLVADLRRGEVWRLVTPIFLHFDAIHLLFNMYWVYQLGGAIEARRKTWRFGLLVLVSAALSNLGQYYYSGNPSFGGMSGVVFALFGYVWMKGMYEPEQGLGLHPNTVLLMLLYLGFTATMGVSRLAHAAHLSGLAVGVLAGVGPHLLDSLRPRQP